jgi:hypothetical protein
MKEVIFAHALRPEGKPMKQEVGVWIDHKEAFVVLIGEGAEETQRIESEVEKHVHRSPSEGGSADDRQDRQFAAHLGGYYDKVVSRIGNAESILLFGPGEAKGEFEKHLASKGLGARVVGVETVDKMTDRQIAAKVRQHYQK